MGVGRSDIVKERQNRVTQLLHAVIDLGREGLHSTTQGVAHEAVPLSSPARAHGRLACTLPNPHKLCARDLLCLHIAREVKALVPALRPDDASNRRWLCRLPLHSTNNGQSLHWLLCRRLHRGGPGHAAAAEGLTGHGLLLFVAVVCDARAGHLPTDGGEALASSLRQTVALRATSGTQLQACVRRRQQHQEQQWGEGPKPLAAHLVLPSAFLPYPDQAPRANNGFIGCGGRDGT
mmetsp:Transcript_92579/g.257880  ORF Transcript_92579/g.257880 Transcript_92579/m.257880 type:complete len:235 (-) Transcript_92579:7-711(-)